MTLTAKDIMQEPAELDGLLASLRALDLQLDVMKAQVTAIRLMVEDRLEAPAGCPHPASQRTYLDGAMGDTRTFDCGLCNERVEET